MPHPTEEPQATPSCRVAALTPATPGAVSILQLQGDVFPVLEDVPAGFAGEHIGVEGLVIQLEVRGKVRAEGGGAPNFENRSDPRKSRAKSFFALHLTSER